MNSDLWVEANAAKKRIKDLEATLSATRERLRVGEQRAAMAEMNARIAWKVAAVR
jgi:hypothetical protein